MTTTQRWMQEIDRACAEPDLARSNRLITDLHYLLSEALVRLMGCEGGPNFHSWAVWGSRKAGVTIRQEDLDSAVHNATITAGIVGSLVGASTGVIIGQRLRLKPDYLTAAIGAGIGALVGSRTGRQIAIRSRAKAAKLMLEGNQILIKDIGEHSARFIELLENGATSNDRKAFFAGFRPGPTEQNGQHRLAHAFRSYVTALDTNDMAAKRAAMIVGNCQIVYHEHIRLEPYIRGAMPFPISFIDQRCATKPLMTYEIGDRALSVGNNLPGLSNPVGAKNWTNIEERMNCVFALFREFHHAPEVLSAPYPDLEILSHRLNWLYAGYDQSQETPS